MKSRTIKKVLSGKIKAWLNSIDDPTVRAAAKEDVIVTGGSITSMLLAEEVSDYDVYFRTKQTVLLVSKYYVDKFIELDGNQYGDGDIVVEEYTEENIKGVSEDRVGIIIQSEGVAGENPDLEEPEPAEYEHVLISPPTELPSDPALETRYRPVFLSENAITLSDKFQIVIRFYGSPDEIHDNYDFIHACNYFDYKKHDLVLKTKALEAILCKELKYCGSLYPICSLFRIRKFINRGWSITAGEMLKIALQISDIDLSNIDTLRSQLTGVDALYFKQLVDAIEREGVEKIEMSHVISIIDEIWA